MHLRASVVIPVFNNWACTRACLESLAAHLRGEWFEILVVDDGSTDGTSAALPQLGAALFAGGFQVISQPENRGFAAAINRGAAAARGEHLFLLNNDTVLVEDCLTPCLDVLAAHPHLAGAGPTLLYPGGERVQHLGVAVAHSIKCAHLYHLFPAAHPVARRTRDLQLCTAAALCLPRQLFLEMGGFHEGYVNGMEDVDFCARAAAAGKRFTVLPEATLIHAEHQSQGRFDREAHNSRLLQERCGDLLVPDMHRLAGEDGYRLAFTPWLDPVLQLGDDRRVHMQACWKAHPSPEKAMHLLDQEPLWVKGYDVSARWLESRGEMAAALAVRVRQGAFAPGLELLDEIARLAQACGDPVRLATARSQRMVIRQAMANWEALAAVAGSELDKARRRGDAPLQEVWERWMRSYSR